MSETSDMSFEGLGEMFEGDSADTCGGKFPIVPMGGQAEGLACADPGARTPIGASGIFLISSIDVGGIFSVSRLRPQVFYIFGILLFLILRNPCKNFKSYVMQLWGFSNGGNNKKNRRGERSWG